MRKALVTVALMFLLAISFVSAQVPGTPPVGGGGSAGSGGGFGFCSQGTEGSLELSDIDIDNRFGHTTYWKEGDEVWIEVEVENTGSALIEQVVLELGFFHENNTNFADQLEFIEGAVQTELGSIASDEDESTLLKFEIPSGIPAGTYKIAIKAFSLAEGEDAQCVDESDDFGQENYEEIELIDTSQYTYEDITECQLILTPGEYTLQEDIETAEQNCITIIAPNTTLDFNGHYIESTEFRDIIRTFGADNTIIRNGTIRNSGDGITLQYSEGSTIDTMILDSNEDGITINYGGGTTITNTVITNSQNTGVALYLTETTIIQNTEIIDNGRDIDVDAQEEEHCDILFEDVIWTAGMPVQFYNQQVTLTDTEARGIILCNADDSIIDGLLIDNGILPMDGLTIVATDNTLISNVVLTNTEKAISMRNSDNNQFDNITVLGSENKAIELRHESNNNIFTNTQLSDVFIGIGIRSSENNIFSELTITNAEHTGISIDRSDNNLIENFLIQNVGEKSIEINGDENTIQYGTLDNVEGQAHIIIEEAGEGNNQIIGNIIRNSHNDGIIIEGDGTHALGNIIKDNIIEENQGFGIKVEENLFGALVYNNYFNNENNYYFDDDILQNSWNTSLDAETNIINGPFVGGNYWANPDGTGFSQLCDDLDMNSICDEEYILEGSNVDYHPLTMIDAHTDVSATIELSPETPHIGDAVEAIVVFQNLGNVTTNVTITSGQTWPGSGGSGGGGAGGGSCAYCIELEPGEIYEQEFEITPTIIGEYSVYASISSYIPDIDLDNNYASVTFIPEPPIEFTRGDANNDGVVNVADAGMIIRYLNGRDTLECEDAADVNDDGRLTMQDATYLLSYLFSGGTIVPAPFPETGTDSTSDGLSCEL